MLTVEYCAQKDVIDGLYRELGITLPASGSNFVLREDGVPIGLMRTEISDVVSITHFNLVKSAMNRENREFFLRAMLYKFSLNPVPLAADGDWEELAQFGFRRESGRYVINSADVNLHGKCKG